MVQKREMNLKAVELAKRAVDVEELLRWTYEDQKADVVECRGVGLHYIEAAADGVIPQNVSRDGSYQIEMMAVLGCPSDRAGGWNCALHPDAEATHAAVLELFAEGRGAAAALVTQYARIGGRPDWIPAGAVFKPVLNHRGKPMKIYDASNNAIGCRVRCHNPPEIVALARRQYRLWWNGLERTAARLAKTPNLLRKHRVTGPAAPALPWAARGEALSQH